MIAFQLAIDTRIDFLNERFAFTVKTTASFVSGNVFMHIVGRYGSENKESPHQYKGAKGSAKDDEDGVIQRIYCSL